VEAKLAQTTCGAEEVNLALVILHLSNAQPSSHSRRIYVGPCNGCS